MVAFAENKIPTGGSRCNADAETQNYYVRNRYYLPTLGRWLTRDPIGYQGGINLYEYVQSSPVANVDAEGLSIGTGLMVMAEPINVSAISRGVANTLEAPFKWIGGVVNAAASWLYAGKMAQVNGRAQSNYYQQIYDGKIPANVTAGSPEQRENFVNGSHAAAKCAITPGTGASGYADPDIGPVVHPEDYPKSVAKEVVKKVIGEP